MKTTGALRTSEQSRAASGWVHGIPANTMQHDIGSLADYSRSTAIRGALLVSGVIISFFLTSPCFAQTTAPVTSRAPAVQGMYEHDSLHSAGAASPANADGKSSRTPLEFSNPLDIRRVAIALAIVLGLVFLCRWAARMLFPSATIGRSSQVMKVLSRSVIAPKQQLLLIQVGRRLVLVGDCGQQMNALAEISDPDEVAGLLGQLQAEPIGDANKPFAPELGRARRQFDGLPIASAADPDDEEGEPVSIGGETLGVDQTRGELSGLTEKIRLLSKQLGKM